jgi:hypothetical protein
MPKEYPIYLHNAASFPQEFASTFDDLQFNERTQAVEVFALQALKMCSSHCHASSILLREGFKGEAVTVLRSVQGLLLDLMWVQQANDPNDRLQRVYQLEADPYARWIKETKLVEGAGSPESLPETSGRVSQRLII